MRRVALALALAASLAACGKSVESPKAAAKRGCNVVHGGGVSYYGKRSRGRVIAHCRHGQTVQVKRKGY